MNTVKCKICGDSTSLFGYKGFNDITGNVGITEVCYHKCPTCGFIFTMDFDHWSKSDFLEKIYNKDYIKVDPDYIEIRPKLWVPTIIENIKKSDSFLDYGAGTDVLCEELRKRGYDASGWDPMWPNQLPQFSDKKFDVISAIEVLEHTPTPIETIDEIIQFLKPQEGKIIISTLANDIITHEGIDYWYIAPRNGHVCMYSKKSLSILFHKFGMKIIHHSHSTHVATR